MHHLYYIYIHIYQLFNQSYVSMVLFIKVLKFIKEYKKSTFKKIIQPAIVSYNDQQYLITIINSNNINFQSTNFTWKVGK